jgi:hypothetical protein
MIVSPHGPSPVRAYFAFAASPTCGRAAKTCSTFPGPLMSGIYFLEPLDQTRFARQVRALFLSFTLPSLFRALASALVTFIVIVTTDLFLYGLQPNFLSCYFSFPVVPCVLND